jgi:superfamily I DNA and/or RNA helicase
VDFALPTINYRVAQSTEDLVGLIEAAPSVPVKMKIDYSRQGFKDQVRCTNALWQSTFPQQAHIRQALVCQDPDDCPLHCINLLRLEGASKLDLTRNFNDAQQKAYASLANTPELTLIHRPFGTGKTTFLASSAIEIVSTPNNQQKILYIVESNPAVDNIALRIRDLADKNSLSHKEIICAYTLKDEKTEVY